MVRNSALPESALKLLGILYSRPCTFVSALRTINNVPFQRVKSIAIQMGAVS